jgi:hypothetical protein
MSRDWMLKLYFSIVLFVVEVFYAFKLIIQFKELGDQKQY